MANSISESPGPLVSIAMSVRNAEETILLAIKSILRQTYSSWELILIDDGSVDATPELAHSVNDSRVHLVADGRSFGLAARLNQAIKLARGKYIARMDADDISCPERLARQVAFLESNPEIDLVGTGSMVFAGKGEALGSFPVRQTHEEICTAPWSGFLLAHPTWMGKREWFVRYGYREGARRAQDQDLLLRAHKHSRYACLPDMLLGYRQARASAKHILMGRYHYGRALWRYGLDSGAYALVAKGVFTQFYRGIAGILGVGLGGAERLLRRRIVAPSETQLKAWQQCWRSVVDSE